MSLADLFGGRSQLLVHHFMFTPSMRGQGCPSCSSVADGYDGFRVHLDHHDVALVAVSRARLVDEFESPGLSAFVLEGGVVYHSYSTYARGTDALWGMWQWLDRAPFGRNESAMRFKRHDEYER